MLEAADNRVLPIDTKFPGSRLWLATIDKFKYTLRRLFAPQTEKSGERPMTMTSNEPFMEHDSDDYETSDEFSQHEPETVITPPPAPAPSPAPQSPMDLAGDADGLNQLRRILVGPSKDEIDSKIEEMMMILDEREAALVRQQTDLQETMSKIEENWSNALADAQDNHKKMVEEIGKAISNMGDEISKLVQDN